MSFLIQTGQEAHVQVVQVLKINSLGHQNNDDFDSWTVPLKSF